jgi:transposase
MDTYLIPDIRGRRCLMKRRTFDPEFKLEAVRLVTDGRRLSEVARDLDIRPDQLRAWKRQLEAQGALDAAPAGGSPEEELRRVKRELEVVRQERDFLKKAAAFFAKGSA